MTEYHKIDSVFKRNQKGKFLMWDWSRPEFEYLAENDWLWTEKIDGTNIRIIFTNKDITEVTFGGRTENAQLPNKLVNWLNYNVREDDLIACFGQVEQVVLYGEGYGAGIQKGGGNYSPDQKFILFDIRVGDWWLKREDVVDIASKLGLDVVQDLNTIAGASSMTLTEMISWVFEAVDWNDPAMLPSSAINDKAKIEGWVGTPVVPLFARNGERIITKVKYKDFKDLVTELVV